MIISYWRTELVKGSKRKIRKSKRREPALLTLLRPSGEDDVSEKEKGESDGGNSGSDAH
jgi:hypothetical protein